MPRPICLHIPHASTLIPAGEIGQFALTEEELHEELVRITDWYTDELFDIPQDIAYHLVFGYSRLLVDPERFREDSDEPMAAQGMGAVYRKTSYGRPLRKPISTSERERLLAQYYDPHHLLLEEKVRAALSEHGRCLIIDCHSFPSNPLPCDMDQTANRPDFCIGADPFHTPDWLLDTALEMLTSLGRVQINRPYVGSMAPQSVYGKDARVSSIMLEINRKLYIDEESGEKLRGFADFRTVLQEAVCKIIHGYVVV